MRPALALALLAGCAASPTCGAELDAAATAVAARWPTAQIALDVDYGQGECVWYWSHGRTSVDGFGATMVTLEDPPGLDDVIDLDADVHATGRLRQPSLLFFDQRDGPLDEWPLIGAGYHFAYAPCERPDVGCLDDDAFFVHEAGYHHVILGDGGMTVALTGDLKPDVGEVDPAGCTVIGDDDLRVRRGFVRHGRAWDVHVWLDPEGGPAVTAIEDPWERWRDATDRVVVHGRAFFVPDPTACGCAIETG